VRGALDGPELDFVGGARGVDGDRKAALSSICRSCQSISVTNSTRGEWARRHTRCTIVEFRKRRRISSAARTGPFSTTEMLSTVPMSRSG
jgi:hypothetical protein